MDYPCHEPHVLTRTNFTETYQEDQLEAFEGPLEHTKAGMEGTRGRLGREFNHILVLEGKEDASTDPVIRGGIFCIPATRNKDEESCEVGWFFLDASAPQDVRRQTLHDMHTRMCSELINLGFKRIIVDMGTTAGANFLSRYYDWIHAPLPEQNNRWIKELS